LIEGLPDPAAFYHVHSFVVEPDDAAIVLGMGEYGVPFVSFVARGNVFGAQCHPEKSSTEGLALLRNFVGICSTVRAA
jgi:glutamine amidotransferase